MKFFKEILLFGLFYFYDRPDRIMIKSDPHHYISPEGRFSPSDPYVIVFEDKRINRLAVESFYDQRKGV